MKELLNTEKTQTTVEEILLTSTNTIGRDLRKKHE